MKIKTSYSKKPIPMREFDWVAYDEETYQGDPSQPLGSGRTEQDAVDDLLDQMELDQ